MVAVAARYGVVLKPAQQIVVTVTAVDPVVAVTTGKAFVALVAREGIFAGSAIEIVVAAIA